MPTYDACITLCDLLVIITAVAKTKTITKYCSNNENDNKNMVATTKPKTVMIMITIILLLLSIMINVHFHIVRNQCQPVAPESHVSCLLFVVCEYVIQTTNTTSHNIPHSVCWWMRMVGKKMILVVLCVVNLMCHVW